MWLSLKLGEKINTQKYIYAILYNTYVVSFTGALCFFAWTWITIWLPFILARKTTLNSPCRAGLLAIYFLYFCLSEKVNFSFNFEGTCSRILNFELTFFFFQHFKNVIFLSFGFPSLWWEVNLLVSL